MRPTSLLLLLALLVAAGCDGGHEGAGTRGDGVGRVLLVGLDGAAPELVDRLIAEQQLPHLAAIARAGASGRLRSIAPLYSPRIWNTIATGKLPPGHGILGFAYTDGKGGQSLYLSHHRKAHALWNIVSRAGKRVGVVNLWNTYPPARVNGVMVSDHLLARAVSGRRAITGAADVPNGPLTYPAEWEARIASLVEDDTPLTDIANPLADDPELPAHLSVLGERLPDAYAEDAKLARIALEIEAAVRPDLLMVLLPGVDRVSHMLWGSLVEDQSLYPEEVRFDAGERRAGRRALETYYRYADALVGLLVERYDGDDLVLVLSDHGFEAGLELDILTGSHHGEAALDGVLFARGPGIAPRSRIEGASVTDVTPTVLAWMGLAVGADMDGRVASFVATDAPETIPTWDTEPIPRLALRPSGAEDELVDRLEALGYLE